MRGAARVVASDKALYMTGAARVVASDEALYMTGAARVKILAPPFTNKGVGGHWTPPFSKFEKIQTIKIKK